jgi:hypothetical protein
LGFNCGNVSFIIAAWDIIKYIKRPNMIKEVNTDSRMAITRLILCRVKNLTTGFNKIARMVENNSGSMMGRPTYSI